MVVNIESLPESLHAEETASGERMTSQKWMPKWGAAVTAAGRQNRQRQRAGGGGGEGIFERKD